MDYKLPLKMYSPIEKMNGIFISGTDLMHSILSGARFRTADTAYIIFNVAGLHVTVSF